MRKIFKSTLSFLIRASRDVLIVLAIGLTISLIFSWGRIFKSADVFLRASIYSLVIGVSLWKTIEIFSNVVKRFYPWEKRPKLTLTIEISGTIIISAIVIFVVNYYLYFLISPHHLSKAPQFFFLVGIVQLFISMVISSIFIIWKFFLEWQKLLVNEELLKREALASQYEALKSYVNPHFLFNSLSVLDSMVDTNPIKAKEFISMFADVYRYILQQKDKELVSLSDELDFATTYIQLYKTRHGDTININIEVPDRSGFLVPVSLQILLENAFKHNEASNENPLTVSISREGDELIVVNNYQPRKVIIDNQGIGLKTIDRRYEQLSNRKVNVLNEGGFFKACLPIIPNFDFYE